MLLAYCQYDLAKRHVGALLPGLLAVLLSFWSPSAAAQSCSGNPEQGCMKPGAPCEAPGIAHGTCNNVPGPHRGELECRCTGSPPTPAPPQPTQPTLAWCQQNNLCPVSAPLANHLFYIQDLGGGRCIDAGPPQSWGQGSPVFINACNHTNGQEIQVAEIDSNDHDVGLSVYPIPTNAPLSAHLTVTVPTTPGASTGATNTGYCIGVHGGTVAPGAALELQTCNPLSPAQRFAVDGDAILMGSQTTCTVGSPCTVARDFVIERQNGSTVAQTPLVVATRNLGEEETLRIDGRYFRFDAVDGSGAAPTSGFLTVANETVLACAAECGWGTVAQIDPSQPLVLTNLSSTIAVADGTTIRGYRSQTFNGPQIQTCAVASSTDWPVFQAPDDLQIPGSTGKGVRFTGFRLRGPGDPSCGQALESELQTWIKNGGANQTAIAVDQSIDGSLPLPSVWIDHMEISHWPAAGSGAGLPYFPATPKYPSLTLPSPCTGCAYPDTPIALMVGNFMHNDTYEVGIGGPIFAQIRANVFYEWANQPVSSRQMSCDGGYAAMDNLFLSEVAVCSNGKKCSSDDVDMHGSFSLTGTSSWNAGLTGDYFDVGWNTFLKTNGPYYVADVNQRGSSCRFLEVHDNVFLQGSPIGNSGNPAPVEYGNPPNAQDPTQELLLVGDFDGDQIDDVFLATGAAWYYSSGGQAEWRYLNRASDPASALLLGDFDGDHRADVLAVHGPNIDVSWAGVSAWQTINQTAWPLADLAVGDFDGDGRSDLLLATGTQWFFASGGQNWEPWAPLTDTILNLRFGHFTDPTKTQVLRVQKQNGIQRWQVMEWPMKSWTDIPDEAPVDSVSGLVAGDFDGDGYTELAESGPLGWVYTSPGRSSSWSPPVLGPIQNLPIGNFQGGKQDGVITWSDKHFYFTHACTNQYPCPQSGPQQLSRQPMR